MSLVTSHLSLTCKIMTRRRFYASPENFARDALSATLDADETRHLREVLRLRPGDEVYLFNGEGLEFLCEVETIERRGPAVLKIKGEVRAARPESALQLTLALALLKGKSLTSWCKRRPSWAWRASCR